MCGPKSKTLLLGLALLSSLSSLSLSADEQVYEITESELEELETILDRQKERIDEQQKTLETLSTIIERQRDTLTTLSTTIETQHETIAELGTSFDEYESAATGRLIRIGAVSFGVGVAAGGIATLLLTGR